MLDSSFITIIEGKGEHDKNAQEHFFVDIFIVLANLHKGKVYKLIYPSIVVDNHKLRSIWLIGDFCSLTIFIIFHFVISEYILYTATLPIEFPNNKYSSSAPVLIAVIGYSISNGINSWTGVLSSRKYKLIFPPVVTYANTSELFTI